MLTEIALTLVVVGGGLLVGRDVEADGGGGSRSDGDEGALLAGVVLLQVAAHVEEVVGALDFDEGGVGEEDAVCPASHAVGGGSLAR